MSRRRTKRNPGVGLALVAGTVLAAIGGAVALLLRKTAETDFERTPAFTGLPAAAVAQIAQDEGLCLVAVNGAAGFKVSGIPNGENVLLQIVQPARSDGSGITAVPIDPRLPPGLPAMQVPAGAVSGGGDCDI